VHGADLTATIPVAGGPSGGGQLGLVHLLAMSAIWDLPPDGRPGMASLQWLLQHGGAVRPTPPVTHSFNHAVVRRGEGRGYLLGINP